MESTNYLPDESFSFLNYPEIEQQLSSIEELLDYALMVNTAINDYNSGTYDKIDVNVTELNQYLQICKDIINILGNAPKVCFEVLLQLREIQKAFQTLLYINRRYHGEYIGIPSEGGSE